MILRECRVPRCPHLTRRNLCIEHQDEADARALIDYARDVLGVDVEALMRDTDSRGGRGQGSGVVVATWPPLQLGTFG